MYLDVADLRTFYDLPLGQLLRGLIGEHVRLMWPDLTRQSLLGIGYAGPFMRPYLGQAEKCMAAMPAQQGAVPWPQERETAAALVQDASLPFSDAVFDRVMMVHALDHCSDASAILEEAWRVLAPGGKLLAIVPNRRGLWSQSELSPFGYGRPYSRGQLKDLLRNCHFEILDDREALFMPPTKARSVLRAAWTWERIGRRIWPAFGGLLLMEAEKKVYRTIPSNGNKSPLRVLKPVFVPKGAPVGLKPVRRTDAGPTSV
ncbi:methyltransferase family protein [Roseibium hamelinense]|uniref:Methyltransferase family protein n=1 Tax=Roseibium hamelinense TaxID=150831 RepID=A0A562SPT8_9HYPH|nr:class I SAM-dependent methyltransferase [Roseibium hamelinense]MTI44076.1 class I SAM-dependent methyltransferase [Roseibium hamelinense]TWI82716.1 methyltransferase family protein [Roseibium hamelinense]